MSVLESEAEYTGANDRCANVKAPFEGLRKKRHLTFPAGSTVVVSSSVIFVFLKRIEKSRLVVYNVDTWSELKNTKQF